MKNLHIYQCMDVMEFNMAVRSLGTFLKNNKGVGLVVVDGLHFVEHSDYVNQHEKKRDKSANQKIKMNTIEAEDIDADDFFSSNPKQGLLN